MPSAVKDAAWPVSDLDRHVVARIEARGLKPAPDAAKHTWLRRVTFDPEKLTYRHGGRDQRLTDVSGKVIAGLIA